MIDNSRFKLYYDDEGDPICYSMDDLEYPNWIQVTPLEFAVCDLNIKVHKGKILKMKDTRWLLQISDSGTPCDPTDVSLVVNENVEDHVYWNYKLVSR